jgi:hypothetical protein
MRNIQRIYKKGADVKPGRSSHVPTDDTRKHVLISRGLNIPLKRICAPMGIGVKALKKHYAAELREGFAYVCEVADKSLLKLMAAGNLGAIVWFDKTRRGMREGGESAAANAPPPPKLGISFELGGPGRIRETPYELPQVDDVGISTTPDAPDVLDDPSHIETSANQKQVFLPKPKQIEQDPKPALSLWERLAMSPAEFSRLPDQQQAKADETLRNTHIHEAKPDSVCPGCRQLWVVSS